MPPPPPHEAGPARGASSSSWYGQPHRDVRPRVPILEVRPPEGVIQCFLEATLQRGRGESCRRTLDARHLSLVDCHGDALADVPVVAGEAR